MKMDCPLELVTCLQEYVSKLESDMVPPVTSRDLCTWSAKLLSFIVVHRNSLLTMHSTALQPQLLPREVVLIMNCTPM